MSQRPSGTVTFLFTDVESSTRKWEEHQVAMQGAMARHDELVRNAIESAGGSVFTTAGDSFCAAFASCESVLEGVITAQVAVEVEDWGIVSPFRVRMALHSGTADERDGDYFGPPLNRCARLLSTGHGGQILISSATEQLLKDVDMGSAALVDLGAHRLKDLDREERVYQVTHSDLPDDFPALRSQGDVLDAADDVAAARQAHASQQWRAAFDAYGRASTVFGLDAEDVQRFSEAAFWAGKADQAIELIEKAYATYLREGKNEAAALQAVKLADLFGHRLASAVSKSWRARAEGLLEGHEESPEYGYLLRHQAVEAFGRGERDLAIELARQVKDLGLRHSDRNLEALGLQDEGRYLVSMGRIDDGMKLMDEAMVAAVGGELNADTTGRSYCNMLAVCDDVADYKRAGEWVDATEAWCENHSDSSYPGVCRIFSVEMKWRRGAWDDAADDVRRAVGELSGLTDIIGVAWYQLGEIQLRAGHLEAAEETFGRAHENGKMPIPGLAHLYLVRGDAQGAVELLSDALQPGELTPLARARLLPTWIDAQIALGEFQVAKEAVAELEETCKLTNSIAFDAATGRAKGVLALGESRPEDAVARLQGSVAGWSTLQMPYEAADARVLLGEARIAVGNKAAARLDLKAARGAFARLGADADVERVEALIGD